MPWPVPVHYDTKRWPIAVVTVDGALSDAEFEEMLLRMEAWLERGPHVMVVDIEGNIAVDVRHLRKGAAWHRSHREQLQRQPGTIFVFNSPFMRAAISLVYKLSSTGQRYRVCSTADEARTLAAEIVSELDLDESA